MKTVEMIVLNILWNRIWEEIAIARQVSVYASYGIVVSQRCNLLQLSENLHRQASQNYSLPHIPRN